MFEKWWHSKNKEGIITNDSIVFYGYEPDNIQKKPLNLCLLIAKYYIYGAYKKNEKVYFSTFLIYLKNWLEIETVDFARKINV